MKFRIALVAALALSLGLAAQGIRRDGEWEVKMQMSMPGMDMPATTVKQCITKEEAADPQKSALPAGRGRGNTDCKVADYKVVGNKVTYTMTCPSNNMTMHTEIVYKGDTYDGTMTTSMARGGQPMTMTSKISGKRLGDCTK